MEHKRTAYEIFSYLEIIGRFIDITSRFEGPSCFPVEVNFFAGNRTEPPVITVSIHSIENDGSTRTLFETGVDQNTSLESFLDSLDSLGIVADRIVESLEKKLPYEQLASDDNKKNNQQQEDENSDLPF